MKELPKKVYITLEHEGDDAYLIANDNIDCISPNQKTGIYELINIGTIKEEKQFISKGEI